MQCTGLQDGDERDGRLARAGGCHGKQVELLVHDDGEAALLEAVDGVAEHAVHVLLGQLTWLALGLGLGLGLGSELRLG